MTQINEGPPLICYGVIFNTLTWDAFWDQYSPLRFQPYTFGLCLLTLWDTRFLDLQILLCSGRSGLLSPYHWLCPSGPILAFVTDLNLQLLKVDKLTNSIYCIMLKLFINSNIITNGNREKYFSTYTHTHKCITFSNCCNRSSLVTLMERQCWC